MKQIKLKQKALTGKSSDLEHKGSKTIINLLFDEKVTFKGRVTGTIFNIFSGVLLYLDKIFILFGINSTSNYGFTNFYNFIWVFMQGVTPIFIILTGIYLKPYKSSYLVPIYCYAIQIIWTFNPEYADDFLLTMKFSSGLVVIILGIVALLKKLISLFYIEKNKNEEFIEDTKEVLDMLKSKILDNNP
ncbi:hypothetical protein [Aquimarina aquimarini]|uniref:hypothetical protein n=1 Tax=Aquimarina aquimarini TaxID=1191734 RepID=UPI000D55986F|nr:hypothetical protein [Aquimarina aquimarini]